MVLECKPTQVTLVPDAIGAITSSAGWDTIANQSYLTEVIQEFQRNGIRTSIFVDPLLDMIEGAKKTGTDRIELYTEAFAHEYSLGNVKGIDPYVEAAQLANELELGINAGHDLSLDNIQFFKQNIPGLLEVSIGHALISEAIKRDISSKALNETKREVAGGNKTKVTVSIVDAISSDDAKKIVKEIKELKLKVQASIRGDVVRVEGKAIDDLQEAIKAIRGCDFDFPVNFTNLK